MAIFNGNAGNNTIFGTTLADLIRPGAGDDTVYADDGNDLIDDALGGGGGGGNDTFFGGGGEDTIYGYTGNDLLYGEDKDDLLFGEQGRDTLDGGSGADTLNGGDGNDLLLGGGGRDSLTGGSGRDRLEGGDSRDVLVGGENLDTLDGGAGDDRYDFNSVDDSNIYRLDRILSFDFGGANSGDKIDVSDVDADLTAFGTQSFQWGGTSDRGKTYLWTEDAGNGDTIVMGNLDDDASAEFQIRVADGALINSLFWAESDFIL
jgi:Ca2+-binding RTX toxin-like protein